MKEKIKLTIQEIVNDYYNLAETEGFLSGLAEANYCTEEDTIEYHNKMKDMINKYLPSWKKNINERYWANDASEDEKGVILSTVLCENFKEIFYQLI